MSTLLITTGLVVAGVFFGSGSITDSANPQFIVSFNRVVHPAPFTGAGGELVVQVCVDTDPGDEALVPTVQRAVALWNALTPRVKKDCADDLLRVAVAGAHVHLRRLGERKQDPLLTHGEKPPFESVVRIQTYPLTY